MGLGGEYLGVSVPAPLALHVGREATCGVNSRAAVNRRLSTRVRRGPGRALEETGLETAGRAGTQFQSAGPACCLMERIIRCRCRLSPVVCVLGIVREFHGELYSQFPALVRRGSDTQLELCTETRK